ncbi:MAG: PLP-dependent aspartate aminotransferase family protein [Betaproteobacteria bacterium]|nr:PLP-dependent aspartate aminotransferase family protein [Betaproteobacteria bacterium]MCL2886220.1 PLP-dependent aspartate aminotransferase family protein [Betaproteobacteria bacterium]
MKPETACIHAVRDATQSTGAVAVPIYQSATFAHPGAGQSTGYDYTRAINPTREHVEKLLAALEGGAEALAFASGMAGMATVLELLSPGDEMIATDDLYGGSIRLFEQVSRKNGVNTRYVDTSDLAAVKAAITDKTKAIFIESPTNPMMKVSDIAGIRELIGDREILLIVDNTFLSPYFCNPIALGADVVVHSGTKYLAGHNDTLAGFVVVKSPEIGEKLRFLQKTIGGVLSPFDAFLVTRGIKTLAIRMEKAQQNALALTRWLQKHPKVSAVHYVGLPEHPAYALSQRQARGFGAMISFSVDSAETASAILNKVELILYAESLGGVETLITHPLTQTHADVPESERLARGIDEKLLRLSVGIEAVEDIIADMERAMK